MLTATFRLYLFRAASASPRNRHWRRALVRMTRSRSPNHIIPPAGSPEGDRLLLARLRTHIVLSRLMIEHSVELVRQTQEAIATLDRMQRLRQCDE